MSRKAAKVAKGDLTWDSNLMGGDQIAKIKDLNPEPKGIK
jgi:hypothetical protein